LGYEPGTRPIVVDSFAGGGSIPLEAMRVGADSFASDLNSVAVLLNKVILECIPKYGQLLAHEVRIWGQRIKEEAQKELDDLYPKDSDGAEPIAYLWARTIKCEGPGCGAEVPLLRSKWLAKKANHSVALQLVPGLEAKRVDFQIIMKEGGEWVDQSDPQFEIKSPNLDGSVKRGSATCPSCGYTTPVERVRIQLAKRRGGTDDALPFCKVVNTTEGATEYRALTKADFNALNRAVKRLAELGSAGKKLPTISLPPDGALGLRVQKYGVAKWADLFLPRQKLQLLTYLERIQHLRHQDTQLLSILKLLFGLTVSKLASFSSSLCVWRNVRTCVAQTFGRQTLSMVWDFGEMNPFAQSAGDFGEAVEYLAEFVEHVACTLRESGVSLEADAAASPLADNVSDLFFTDPPYYDAIPYQHLSEFFSLWLVAGGILALDDVLASKSRNEECIVDEKLGKTRSFFEEKMTRALSEGHRVSKPNSVGVVIFAHKSTEGWEAQLTAMLDANWIITSSWPIDTERTGRLRAQDSAALGSSVHIVCRPRENLDSSAGMEEIGDWRDVLQELPRRIHKWMPRLADEGVVGADAIFACLGPALEVFSRYSRVEKPNGDPVGLKEYLEHVWAAISKEALSMIFEGASTEGFEPDSRLTAMWLWTLAAAANKAGTGEEISEDEPEEDEEALSKKSTANAGFSLEYDAARKIAQGLGAYLEDLDHVVEVKGETARLLSVGERVPYFFGKEQEAGPNAQKKKPKNNQLDLFKQLTGDEPEENSGARTVSKVGETTLDRVHQSMLLFAANRGEALRRFLIEDGAGQDQRFWRLAQALSALYPNNCNEKRWVDGVLARKKGLGL
jgi:adenine-specific DNA methylase